MAKRRTGRGKVAGGGEAGKLVAGLLVGAGVAVGGMYLYQHTPGQSRSSAVQPAIMQPEREQARRGMRPTERSPGGRPPGVSQREDAEGMAPGQAPVETMRALKMAPFGTSEEVFEAGARAYAAQCAGCHGRPGARAARLNPDLQAAQLWDPKDAATQRLVQRPTGEIYRSIAVGMVAKGMPAYAGQMADTEIWDLALLLKNVRTDLPDPVLRLLHGRK